MPPNFRVQMGKHKMKKRKVELFIQQEKINTFSYPRNHFLFLPQPTPNSTLKWKVAEDTVLTKSPSGMASYGITVRAQGLNVHSSIIYNSQDMWAT